MRPKNITALRTIVAFFAIAIAASTAGAQQDPVPPLPPITPGNSPPPSDQQSPADVPQAPSLTGAIQTPLALPVQRSFLLPAVAYYGNVNSNAYNVSNSNRYSLATLHSIVGAIVLQRIRPHSQFDVGYLAGQAFSNRGGLNSTTQEFGILQAWNYSRVGVLLADQFSYSSQAALLGGASIYDLAGIDQVFNGSTVGPLVLRNSFAPNQSIFTPFGPRLNNSSIGQMDYHLSGRTDLTVVGNYNTLRFTNPGLIDSSTAGFQTGINHRRTRKDTIGIAYRFSSIWFNGFPDSIRDHLVEVIYERQWTRRLTARIGAGPEISGINAPPVQRTRASWAGEASLAYLYERMSVGLSYDHRLTSGGGVFLGSVTDRVTLSARRDLTRLWSLSVAASYGRNTNLLPVQTATLTAPAGAHFNSEYGGFTLHRRLGWQTEAFAGYIFRHQTSSVAVCGNGVCGRDLTGHMVNFGVVWRPERIPIT